MMNLEPQTRLHIGHERAADLLRTAQRDQMLGERRGVRRRRSSRRRVPSLRQILRRLRPAVHQEAR